MATHRHEPVDPIQAEGLELLEDDAALSADLEEFERRLDAGQIPASELHSTEDVRRRLGLPPPDATPPTDELV
ncbi:MAG: hypothetical protein JF886_11520 [Candidatus Dormibacteraeota bacterium]|uniref:Uncharacterized protein n=1 Tax=Candidatus Aeolococcus gillhamiae TaxID=3127015 RepID=A0A2W5ZZ03_9BACT|nr:hypothetical protein [Candidatus Dormibacteraeota bacterium]PZR78518.1 MAG: hypothetical protein DLM65_12745 [Candidatus Dormibacter sp. RRmetagenome_bin12]